MCKKVCKSQTVISGYHSMSEAKEILSHFRL